MVRLKDVEGLMIEMDVQYCESCNDCEAHRVLYVQGQRGIGHNLEKLAKHLYNRNQMGLDIEERCGWELASKIAKNHFYREAAAIISAEASILEFRQEKGK